MSRVIHFEIPAEDPERAINFYERVFSWEIQKWEHGDYWLVSTGSEDENGINGAIYPKETGSMVRDTINVESYDEFAKKIEANGGKMLTGKMPIPGMGFNGLFKDTEGNVFGIIEVTMVYISRLFNADLADVWEAWTEPEHVKEWLAPKNYTAPVVKMDLQVGGSYLNSMKSSGGDEVWSTGVYREVVPEEKIVSTDSFADSDGNVVPASHYGMTEDWPMELAITVTFREEDGATRLTIEHQGFPDHNNSAMAEAGWQESLDKLEAHLKTMKR
jgi:uncharacterized protein YndB with AHSA1/START domain/predicted enzyme related to lactoylglutathione lyase